MAQLIVVAEAANLAVAVGGKAIGVWGRPKLAVSVTKPDGSPVKGLAGKNFSVHYLPGGPSDLLPDFVAAEVHYAKEQAAPGVYVLALQPETAVAPEKVGQKYLYAVAVATGRGGAGDRGQTLTTLEGVVPFPTS